MELTINNSRLTQGFMDMVRVASPSGQEAEFARYLLYLGRKLGLTCRQDRWGNLYLFIAGQGRPLMLNTHLDTVSPGVNIQPRFSGRYITSDGSTVLGADSKAGIAAMFEAVTVMQNSPLPHRPLLITLSCNEESGLPTAGKIISDIKTCIVPDRGTPLGEIITAAPFAQVFYIEVHGKSAYAQTNYDRGRHAIMAAVRLISALPWGNIDPETTANVGIIQGGRMTSQIPDYCSFKGSCYSFNSVSLTGFMDRLAKTAARIDTELGTRTRIKLLESFVGYSIDRADPLVQETVAAVRSSGLRPRFKIYKAVTNANLLNQIGIKTVLISTGVVSQHTVRERIAVSDLIRLSQILINLIRS